MKKTFVSACILACVLSSCSSENEMSIEMMDGQKVFDCFELFDWSSLSEEPSDFSMYLFPKNSNEAPSLCLHAENFYEIESLQKNYDVIYFNETPEDFPGLTFFLNSFQSAHIKVNNSADMLVYEGTRGFNKTGSLAPKPVAATTSSSTESSSTTETRGFNKTSTLKPQSIVVFGLAEMMSEDNATTTRGFSKTGSLIPKSVPTTTSSSTESSSSTETRGFNKTGSLKPKSIGRMVVLQVSGLSSADSVKGSLSNLSSGINLSTGLPLQETYDQVLPADAWTLELDEDSNEPVYTIAFSSFGVPVAETRSEEVENVLTLEFSLPINAEGIDYASTNRVELPVFLVPEDEDETPLIIKVDAANFLEGK